MIVVTDEGIVVRTNHRIAIYSHFSQLINEHDLNAVTNVRITICFSDLQSLNASSLIKVTDDGIAISSNEKHL